jgi:N6-L-threonylcarbamoyladenine synthase
VLGRTRDDAAGEAFDKVGRALGLPYPGGPEIDRLAESGDPMTVSFPQSVFEDSLDFSFSGLKSAVLQYMQKNKDSEIADIAASFQRAAVETLVSRSVEACVKSGLSKIALAGGVAANKGLRQAMGLACQDMGLSLQLPPPVYCTDNAAMVAGGGYYRYLDGRSDRYDLNAYPNMDIEG